MADPLLTKWRCTGTVFFWRYAGPVRHYPGWHLTADDPACDGLLDLFDRIRRAQFASRVAIPVTRPTERVLAVPASRGRVHAPAELGLCCDQEADPHHWQLAEDGGRANLTIGIDQLAELERCIRWVRAGGGHCSEDIGDGDQSLSFWWLLE